jgi:hypothetical protein
MFSMASRISISVRQLLGLRAHAPRAPAQTLLELSRALCLWEDGTTRLITTGLRCLNSSPLPSQMLSQALRVTYSRASREKLETPPAREIVGKSVSTGAFAPSNPDSSLKGLHHLCATTALRKDTVSLRVGENGGACLGWASFVFRPPLNLLGSASRFLLAPACCPHPSSCKCVEP